MQQGTMPQFGVQNHNNLAEQPVQPSHGMGGFGPQPQFGNAVAPKAKKPNPLTNLKKEQVLPALVAIFGFLALIFLVSTIVLAVSRNGGSSSTSQNAGMSIEGLQTDTLGFSTKKLENIVDGATYKYGKEIRNNDGQLVIATSLIPSNNGANFEVNWEFAPSYYSISTTRVDQETFLLISENPISDLMIARASNDVNDDVLLVLYNNGTVGYMPIRESLEKYSFKIVGTIEGLTGVVKFYRVSEALSSDAELTETVFAQKVDGSIVDLRADLLKAVGKDIK